MACKGEKATLLSSEQDTILSMLHGMWQNRCLSLIVGLKIPELLCSSEESSISIEDIATKSGCKSSNQLYPLMKALAQAGIGKEFESKHFGKNRAMELLRRDKGPSLGHMVEYFCSEEYISAMKSLAECLKIGQPAFILEHGMTHFQYMNEVEKCPYDKEKMFVGASENLIGSNERRREFALNYNIAMEHVTYLRSLPDVQGINSVFEAFPWSSCKKLVDMGGGKGYFLAAIMKQPGCEHIQGYVVDLPEVIDDAQADIPNQNLDIEKHRIVLVKQDFTKPFPSDLMLQVDTIMFKNVISTLIGDQEKVVKIFRHCHSLFSKDYGRLVIIDSCCPNPGDHNVANGFQINFSNVHQLCITCGNFYSKDEWIEVLTKLGSKSGYRFKEAYDTFEGGYTIFELECTTVE